MFICRGVGADVHVYHSPAVVGGNLVVQYTAAVEGNPAAGVDPADTPPAAGHTVSYLHTEEEQVLCHMLNVCLSGLLGLLHIHAYMGL